MRHSYRPDIPPQPQSYRTQVLDHLGLVAGMFEELGITEVIDRTTQQDPEMRIVTVGHAVKAMVLNGLRPAKTAPSPLTSGVKRRTSSCLAMARRFWVSGSRMFRLQSKRPARHDMLNGDAVILHHNALLRRYPPVK